MLESLPVDILYDKCKGLASDALSSAIRVHEGGLRIQTMHEQLSKEQVPSTIHYHESFGITYRKPNEEKWLLEYEKLNEKGKNALFDLEKWLVNEVFIPTKEVELKVLQNEHRTLAVDRIFNVSLSYSYYLTNIQKFKAKQQARNTIVSWDPVEIALRAFEQYIANDIEMYTYINVAGIDELTEAVKQHKKIDASKVNMRMEAASRSSETTSDPNPTNLPQDPSANDVHRREDTEKSTSDRTMTIGDSSLSPSVSEASESSSSNSTNIEEEEEKVNEVINEKWKEAVILKIKNFLKDTIPKLTYNLLETYLEKEYEKLAYDATAASLKKQEKEELAEEVAKLVDEEKTVQSKTLNSIIQDRVSREFDKRNNEKRSTSNSTNKHSSKKARGGPKNQDQKAPNKNGAEKKKRNNSKSTSTSKSANKKKNNSSNQTPASQEQSSSRKRKRDQGDSNNDSRKGKRRKNSRK